MRDAKRKYLSDPDVREGERERLRDYRARVRDQRSGKVAPAASVPAAATSTPMDGADRGGGEHDAESDVPVGDLRPTGGEVPCVACGRRARFVRSGPLRTAKLVEKLHGLGFVEAAQNVLFRGPSGVGKTTLAKNLGLAALARGHTVRFATLAEVLTDLLKQESAPALERRLRRYVLPDVLVLDEVGYLPADADAAKLLYAIVDRRHEKRATIVTTNLSFKQWGTVFPGAACVVALVDRFAQHCHVIDIDVTVRRTILPLGSEFGDRARPAWHIEVSGPSTRRAAS